MQSKLHKKSVDVAVCTHFGADGWTAWVPGPITLRYGNGCVSSVEGYGVTEDAAVKDCLENLRVCLRGHFTEFIP